MTDALTDDLFFGGRLRLLQPKKGHRFGGDAALLAAAARSRLDAGAAVVDLGAGVGAVGLALAASGAERVALVEIDPDLAALAGENAARNGLHERVAAFALDVAAAGFGQKGPQAGDAGLVVANPPFDDGARHRASPDAARARAHLDPGEVLPVWIAAAERLLAPGGSFVVIHRADALGRLIDGLAPGFGELRVKPVHPRAGDAAGRVLVAGRKGGRGPLALLPGLVMHAPDGRFTAEADAAQRGQSVISLE